MKDQAIERRLLPETCLLAIAIGIFLVGMQWLVHMKYVDLEERGKPTVATVTADKSFYIDVSRYGRGEQIKRGGIQYSVAGRTYEQTVGFYNVRAPGEQIEVVYAPENPNKVADAEKVHRETVKKFFDRSYAGLFIILFGIVGYVTAKKR